MATRVAALVCPPPLTQHLMATSIQTRPPAACGGLKQQGRGRDQPLSAPAPLRWCFLLRQVSLSAQAPHAQLGQPVSSLLAALLSASAIRRRLPTRVSTAVRLIVVQSPQPSYHFLQLAQVVSCAHSIVQHWVLAM